MSGPVALALAAATFGGQAIGAGSLRAPNLPHAVPAPAPLLSVATPAQVEAGRTALAVVLQRHPDRPLLARVQASLGPLLTPAAAPFVPRTTAFASSFQDVSPPSDRP